MREEIKNSFSKYKYHVIIFSLIINFFKFVK